MRILNGLDHELGAPTTVQKERGEKWDEAICGFQAGASWLCSLMETLKKSQLSVFLRINRYITLTYVNHFVEDGGENFYIKTTHLYNIFLQGWLIYACKLQ